MIASSENAESSKLQFEFFISKKQQLAMGGKLASIANKKGLKTIIDFFNVKVIKKITPTLGLKKTKEYLKKVKIKRLRKK